MRTLSNVFLMLFVAAASASAQDSAFAELRVRGGVIRNPMIGQFRNDWRSKTGFHAEAASNVGVGELSLAVSHIGYAPTTSKPPFTGTHISLGWTARAVKVGSASVDIGARVTDVRMDFDDPAIVEGLRTEEEVMLDGIARGRFSLGGQFSAYTHVSYGVLMLSTKAPMLLVSAGIERAATTPRWLRDFLR